MGSTVKSFKRPLTTPLGEIKRKQLLGLGRHGATPCSHELVVYRYPAPIRHSRGSREDAIFRPHDRPVGIVQKLSIRLVT